MNPVDFVKSMNAIPKAAKGKDHRMVKLATKLLPAAFPEMDVQAVWDLWRSTKDEGTFRHEIGKGAIEGLPRWVRIDERAGVDLAELVNYPFKVRAVETFLEETREEQQAFAVVFQVLHRGEWIVHNLPLRRAPETIRLDVAVDEDRHFIVMPLKDFVKERIVTRGV